MSQTIVFMVATPFTIGRKIKKREASDEAPLLDRMRRLFSGSSVYLKAHRRLTREVMHMLHMRIIMDIVAVFFMVLSPSSDDESMIPHPLPYCQPLCLFSDCFSVQQVDRLPKLISVKYLQNPCNILASLL